MRAASLEAWREVVIAWTLHLKPYWVFLSNQGEKSINLYFIRVPLRKKVLKYGTPKPQSAAYVALGLEALV